MEELKVRLRQLRIMLNLSMAEFASNINVSPGNVGDWESLKRPSVPSAAALRSIAETYNVSLDWLLLGYERNDIDYSEIVVSKYTANSYVYEQLVEITLKLTEVELIELLECAKTIKAKNNTNKSSQIKEIN